MAKFGYYTPVMILGAALLVVGANLAATFTVASPASKYIGYQFIYGAGAGLGIQQAHTAAQRVLDPKDVPTGAVVLIFMQILGSTIWTSAASSIFTNRLVNLIQAQMPSLNAQAIIGSGATGLRDVVGGGDKLEQLLGLYNTAVTSTFILGGALAAAMLVASFGMEWLSVKTKPDDGVV